MSEEPSTIELDDAVFTGPPKTWSAAWSKPCGHVNG